MRKLVPIYFLTFIFSLQKALQTSILKKRKSWKSLDSKTSLTKVEQIVFKMYDVKAKGLFLKEI